ncbi:MAG TPA: hypothetical protein VGS57_23140 [Thermoanaerobaculia bacterium]|nr:hypothetical protein [Thermoanaerobaculia bacterium]
MSAPGPLDPQQAFQVVLELFDSSMDLMRQNLRRRYPDANDGEIEARFRRWLTKADQPLSQAWAVRGR